MIAGEGRIDEQSFGGKIVGELVRRARVGGHPDLRGRRDERPAGRRCAARGLERVVIASTLAEIEAAGEALARGARGARGAAGAGGDAPTSSPRYRP